MCKQRDWLGEGFTLHMLASVVSGTTPEAEQQAEMLFEEIAPEIVRMTPTEAEFAKLFANAYRYVQFRF